MLASPVISNRIPVRPLTRKSFSINTFFFRTNVPPTEAASLSGKIKASASRRVAAIDIGSNSLHLIVAEARPGQRFRIVEREKEMVRLAAGTLHTHHISPARMDAAIGTLRRFAALAQALGASPTIVTATSAVREAWNREVFLRRVERETGLQIEILPGVEEARLIALAVSEVTDFGGERALIIDIGGGSTEFILTRGETPDYLASVKLGAVRLHEQFLKKNDPPTRSDVEALTTYARSGLVRTVREIRAAGKFRRVIGTSGSILGLAAALQAISGDVEPKSNPTPVSGEKLSLKGLEPLNRQLQRLSLKERRKTPGVDSRRADIIVAGGLLLETIMRELDIAELTTCDWSLREGMILNYLREHAPDMLAPRTPEAGGESVRMQSVLTVARRYEYEAVHSHHTAKLAGRIFDGTRALHGLGPVEREWLEYGALLHDIGYHISHGSHHKHGMYLIRHAELPGFHTDEVAVIAALVRYHRGSLPKRKHEEFVRLSPAKQTAVLKLVALLRLADAFDRRHQGVVDDLDVRLRGKRLTLTPLTANPCDLELWCADRAIETFRSVFPNIEIDVRRPVAGGRSTAAGNR